jgi:hypothetical protein
MSIRRWLGKQHPLARLYFYTLAGAVLAVPLGAALILLKPAYLIGCGSGLFAIIGFAVIVWLGIRQSQKRTTPNGYTPLQGDF